MTSKLRRRIVALGAAMAAGTSVAWLFAGHAGAQSQPARAVADLRGRCVMAEGSVAMEARRCLERRRRRTGQCLRAASSAHAEARRRRQGRAAGHGVRRRRQFRQILGRPGQRLRLARARAWHPHRSQGLRLDRRQPMPDLRHARPQAGRRRCATQVHARRQVRAADRQEQPEQGRRRYRERASRGGCVGVAAHQRGVRGRRLRQSPRHRVRCRHRRVQADLGRVRQAAWRRRQLQDHRTEDLSPKAKGCRTSTSRTPSACRTMAWCISPIARTAACRCSPATASS